MGGDLGSPHSRGVGFGGPGAMNSASVASTRLGCFARLKIATSRPNGQGMRFTSLLLLPVSTPSVGSLSVTYHNQSVMPRYICVPGPRPSSDFFTYSKE